MATVVTTALVGALVLLGVAGSFLVATAVAHRSAQAAADLAALAAAGSLQSRAGQPCTVAGEVAVANGATITSCEVVGEHVLVVVGRHGPELWGHSFTVTGRARAGPG